MENKSKIILRKDDINMKDILGIFKSLVMGVILSPLVLLLFAVFMLLMSLVIIFLFPIGFIILVFWYIDYIIKHKTNEGFLEYINVKSKENT
jgi:ABC-type bacteriocin/lantibiotic exporter with double-glycine peptidase domain